MSQLSSNQNSPETQNARQKEFVLRTLEERGIRFVRLWFTDVLGFLKSVAVAPAELENAFDEGIGFDGSAIQGFARVKNLTCWLCQIQVLLQFCLGALKHRVRLACFATSSCLMEHRRLRILVMY